MCEKTENIPKSPRNWPSLADIISGVTHAALVAFSLLFSCRLMGACLHRFSQGVTSKLELAAYAITLFAGIAVLGIAALLASKWKETQD